MLTIPCDSVRKGAAVPGAEIPASLREPSMRYMMPRRLFLKQRPQSSSGVCRVASSAGRLREISSISQAQTLTQFETESIGSFSRGRVRSLGEAQENLGNLRAQLATELQQRCDPRMSNAAEAATEFMNSVLAGAGPLHSGSDDPIGAYLATLDIHRSELDPSSPHARPLRTRAFPKSTPHRRKELASAARLPPRYFAGIDSVMDRPARHSQASR
jgi:hypothetical protein